MGLQQTSWTGLVVETHWKILSGGSEGSFDPMVGTFLVLTVSRLEWFGDSNLRLGQQSIQLNGWSNRLLAVKGGQKSDANETLASVYQHYRTSSRQNNGRY